MKNFNHPVYEHPENGKVKNPITGNWVTKSYMESLDQLREAKEATAEYFKEVDETFSEVKEDETLESKAERMIDGEDKSTLNSKPNNDKDQLDETTRVEWDESGQKQEKEIGDRIGATESAEEALGNIMQDIDQKDERGTSFESEDFVDPEAAEDVTEDDFTPPNPHESYRGEEVEDWNGPDHLNMPDFPSKTNNAGSGGQSQPGGIYSTKKAQERDKKRRRQQHINKNGGDPRERPNTGEVARNKRYVPQQGGGMKVEYTDGRGKNKDNSEN